MGGLLSRTPATQSYPSCPPAPRAQLRQRGRCRERGGGERLGLCPGRAGKQGGRGPRSRGGRPARHHLAESWGRALGARALPRPAHSSRSRRELAALGASGGKCSPQSRSRGTVGGPGPARAREARAWAAVGGRRPSLLKALEGGGSGASGAALGRGGGGPGPSGAAFPGVLRREAPARRTPQPWPARCALGALWPRSRRAPTCRGRDPGSAPSCPPGSLAARSPRGRAGSRRQVALGGRPSPPQHRRARAPGHPARPLGPAPRFPISSRSLFSHLPVPRPRRLIQCLVINLAFQNGQRAG